MLEKVRVLGVVQHLLMIRDSQIQVITSGAGLVESLTYFCAYTVNGRTRVAIAELGMSSGILTCESDFIETHVYKCHRIYLIDSLGHEFRLSDTSSRDQVCFIEQIDVEGTVQPSLIPKDATYDNLLL